MSDVLGSGLAFPLSVDHRGAVAMARGEADVEQALEIILGTAPGERPMRPEFGCEVHDFVFDAIDAAMVGRMETAIRRALDRWEPRVEVTGIDFDLGSVGEGRLDITIGYRIRATNHQRNLVYPFYVIPAEEGD
ncbi:GPW/gp25 family protein [Baekduia soli]|uniref:GPW/gp25 family protein n=1 Tax=Baekduia soli TaxID=496014 RepID=A0A5B8U6E0_9ACTN|nr:GPW/gp25 family protein [Baekduia soli]QEC48465.1 GPW/gp25 family protein [Baekduia soli]